MKTYQHLIISGIIFTVVLLLWPIFMGASQAEGSFEEQVKWLNENITLYKIQFFFAFLISPSVLYMMIAQIKQSGTEQGILQKLGYLFLAAYLVLNSIAYASQMTVAPSFIKAEMTEQLKVWYMGSNKSVIYFLNQMGYFFWAAGTLLLFSNHLKQKGIIRYISIIYLVSAVLSVAAFAGLIFENDAMNSMTVISGMILAPIGILTIIWGTKEKRKLSNKI